MSARSSRIELIVYRVVLAILVLLAIGYAAFFNNVPSVDDESVLVKTPPAELVGKNFQWSYENGWSFRVTVQDDGLHWEGVAGSFDGTTAHVEPHYREIAPGVYFMTWLLPNIGFDSVVIDLNERRVFAHTNANWAFQSIEGTIDCNGLIEECTAPEMTR